MQRILPGSLPVGPQKTGPASWRFTVWAPRCRHLDLILPETGTAVPMERLAGGCFTVERAGLAAGARYLFSLDGRLRRPDPASRHQPDDVHGPSALVDVAAFAWTDAGFVPPPPNRRVYYEIHVGTFTPEGTFAAVIARLPHLRELGVTCLELMPVSQFPGGRNWGYDGVAPFAPCQAYGGPAGLARLVDACHAHGLAVVLDVVYNHLGPEGNYLRDFGPYFTDRYRTPWGEAVNYDGPGSAAVRAFFLQNALYWLRDYHIDGLRLDAVHAIYDQGPVHFVAELAETVAAWQAAAGRRAFLVAETHLNDPAVITDTSCGGMGLDGLWNDDFHHAVHAWLTGEKRGYYADYGGRDDVATALADGFVYAGRPSAFFGHVRGRSAGHLPADRFVNCLQNHDQIGNRARGERLVTLVGTDAARLASALLILSPGSPLLFMGEEWGETNPFCYFISHLDAGLVEAVRRGRRREFARFRWRGAVPDPFDGATFAASRPDWGRLAAPDNAAMLAWYRALLALRAASPALRETRRHLTRVWPLGDAKALAMERRGADGRFLCLVNAAARPARVGLGASAPLREYARVLDAGEARFGGAGRLMPERPAATLTLPAFGAVVYQRQEDAAP
ncbi:MAG: malto-oligosyltrehalose trehalohydrolase [Solidesulfovibrio sp.]|uniref:malto-oligosyltrehalose trehalohydrolase n=1 Tax=Solidesulfovibrio sp. TaxID=2910990 RepID=UPI00315815BC